MFYTLQLITLPKVEATPETTEEDNEEPTTRTVSFTVDDGENAVGGASVVIDSDTDNAKTTGTAGGCTATLTDGEHTVTVSKEGYETATETVTVDSTHTSFTISLTES